MVIMAILCGFIVSSCGSDKNSLSGVYGCNEYQGYGQVLEFVNHNTVKWYKNAHKGKFTSEYGVVFNKQIGNSSWYNNSEGGSETYTYTYESDVLIIPMIGKIFSVQGNSLYENGSSLVFTK